MKKLEVKVEGSLRTEELMSDIISTMCQALEIDLQLFDGKLHLVDKLHFTLGHFDVLDYVDIKIK